MHSILYVARKSICIFTYIIPFQVFNEPVRQGGKVSFEEIERWVEAHGLSAGTLIPAQVF